MSDVLDMKNQANSTITNVPPVLPEGNGKAAEDIKTLLEAALKKQADEFDAKLKTAITTEKDKLYETLNVEKDKAKQLKAELDKYKKEEEVKTQELEAKKKEEMDIKDRLKELEAQTKVEQEKFSNIMSIKDSEFKAELKARDLAMLKKEKILESKGQIIPELVTGNSEEEILQSVEVAKQRYAAIMEEAKQKTEAELLKSGKLPTSDGLNKQEKDISSLGDRNTSWQKLMTMSPEEVKKQAAQYLESLK